MRCEGCGKREATQHRAGAKEGGGWWQLALCDECAPKPLTEEEQRAWVEAFHREYPVTLDELDKLKRMFGVED